MKKRNPAIVGFLTLCTLGLYGLYWLSSLHYYLSERGFKAIRSKLVVWLFLLIPIIIAADVFLHTYHSYYIDKVAKYSPEFTIAILVLIILYPLAYFLWASSFHRILSEATNGKLSNKLVALPYGLGFLAFMQLQLKMNQWLTTTVLVTDQPGPPPPYIPPPEPPKPTLLDQIPTPASPSITHPNRQNSNVSASALRQPTVPITTPEAPGIITPDAQVPVSGDTWQEGMSTVHKTFGIMPENTPKLPDELQTPINETITPLPSASEKSLSQSEEKSKPEETPPPPPEPPKPPEAIPEKKVTIPPPPPSPAVPKPVKPLPPPPEEDPLEGGEIHIPHNNS